MKKLILVLLVAFGTSLAATAQHNQVWVQNNSPFDFCVQTTSWQFCVNSGASINSPLVHIPSGGGALFQGDPVHMFTTQVFLLWDDTFGGCATICPLPAQVTMGPATGNLTVPINHVCMGASVTVNWNSSNPCYDAVVDIF